MKTRQKSRQRIRSLIVLSSTSALVLALTACSGQQPQQTAPVAQAQPAAAPAPVAAPVATAAAEQTPAAPAQAPAAAAPPAVAPATVAPPAPAAAPAPRPVPAPQPAAAAAPPAAAPAPVAAPAPAPAAAPQAPAKAAPAPKPAPRVAELKAGQPIVVRTTRVLSTDTMKSGDAFSAIVDEPIVIDGWTVVAAGAKVDGRIAEVDKGGRIKGKANMTLELVGLTASNGKKYEIVTSPVSSEAASSKGKDVAKVGIGAGAGAAVGAIAGGGKGAAIGAIVGGGAGAAMRGDAAEVPAESVITFELRTPVTIKEGKTTS